MKRVIPTSILVAVFVWVNCTSVDTRGFAQLRTLTAPGHSQSQIPVDSPASVFAAVEAGVRDGDVRAFNRYFANQIYLSLGGTESGYYSASQASCILQNHFSVWKTVGFRFSTMSDAPSNSFATGAGRFANRSIIRRFQLYIATTPVDGRWVIIQFNVY
jgi:hypothetical protein